MGLNSKQVSSDNDGFDVSQGLLQDQRLLPMNRQLHQQQQQERQKRNQPMTSTEQVKCPRCGSTNTKFCYFNNYNKLQPRHFCKACKRHWTQGGALRNVPVGGVRKNKGPRTKTSPSFTRTASATSAATNQMGHQLDQQRMNLIRPPQLSLLLQPAFMNFNELGVKNLFNMSAITDPVLQDLNDIYCWPSCSSPSEVSSWQHPILTGTATTPMNFSCHPPWTLESSCVETVSSTWNWDEFDKLVSGNPSLPWDDPALHIIP